MMRNIDYLFNGCHFSFGTFPQGLERTLDDHKILLLEAAPDKAESITSIYSNRVSSITPGSKKLLESKLKVSRRGFTRNFLLSWLA